MPPLTLRPLVPADMPTMQRIYAPYVTGTTVSFETQPPDVETLARRMEALEGVFPKIACERDGEMVGYAYANRLGERAAYSWSATAGIYVEQNCRRTGAGRALYTALAALLKAQGYCTLYALVSHPNPASEAFHERMGFVRQGLLERAGNKFGRFMGVAYYALPLSGVEQDPAPPLPLSALDAATVRRILEDAVRR